MFVLIQASQAPAQEGLPDQKMDHGYNGREIMKHYKISSDFRHI